MKRQGWVVLSGVQLLLLSNTAVQSKPTPDVWPSIHTLSVGLGWNGPGDARTFFLQPDIEKTFTATVPNRARFQAELFSGWQRPLPGNLWAQAGIAFAGANQFGVGGDIWEDADPEFDNYTYNYKISHLHAALEGKVLADIGLKIMPYVNGSIGLGVNTARHFIIRPKISNELPMPFFQSRTNTAFTYTLGAGVQRALNQHWQAGIGYLFSDWGKSQLGAAPGQTLNSGLAIRNIHINSLVFNLSYIG